MRNCQVRLNMNYEIYIEESSPVRVLSDVIDEIYQKEEYTIVAEVNEYDRKSLVLRHGLDSCVLITDILLRFVIL